MRHNFYATFQTKNWNKWKRTTTNSTFHIRIIPTGHLIGNKAAVKFSPENSSETVINEIKSTENDKELLKERYLSPETGQKIIDDLRLK